MIHKTLYILSPEDSISPFDVTLAADAGFNHIIPFPNVQPQNVKATVQDAIFARPPEHFNDTGIFIGGRDVHLASDMFQQAKNAMVGTFEVGIIADPNGAYTTAASVLALVQKTLVENFESDLYGRTVVVLGTGPVGLCTAILAKKEGAVVRLCQLTAEDNDNAIRFCQRYQVSVDLISTLTSDQKIAVLEDAEIVICAAKSGIRVLDKYELDKANNLLVVADTNAVPPSGVEGVGMDDLSLSVDYVGGRYRSIGALAIGKVKYQVEFGLFKHLQESTTVALIDFPESYEYALSLVKSP